MAMPINNHCQRAIDWMLMARLPALAVARSVADAPGFVDLVQSAAAFGWQPHAEVGGVPVTEQHIYAQMMPREIQCLGAVASDQRLVNVVKRLVFVVVG